MKSGFTISLGLTTKSVSALGLTSRWKQSEKLPGRFIDRTGK